MEKYGFVYIWFDRKHKRYYIGMHWGTENDGYICSSAWMIQAYKRRPQDFKRRILEKIYTNRKELYEAEVKWLSFIDDKELKIKYYNLSKNVHDSWLNEKNLTSRLEKISIKTKEAMNTPEVREKYLDGLAKRNNKSSDLEVREKRSKSMKGKNAGKITVKFATGEGKAFHVTKDDPRLLTGELVSASKGVKRNPHTNERKEHLRKTSQFHTINSIKKKCNYCEFIGVSAHLARYHNDKCKKKPQFVCLGQ
jgi:hypothetical protein